ncbi:hypothetical protein ACFGVR_14820 [Mucilaginibacter sp. AW1-3]
MKAIITSIPTLLPAIAKHLPVIDLSWSKAGHYIFSVLREAFRDNVVSEVEMEFLLLLLTGFVVAAKETLSGYVAYAKNTIK